MNFLNDSLVKVDEQQVSEMIDRVCNQSREMQSSEAEQKENYQGITATPEQLKMVAYDSSITRARGLDTDKENFQANKPVKRHARSKKTQNVDIENHVHSFQDLVGDNKERKPFQPLGEKMNRQSNVLQDIGTKQQNSPFDFKINHNQKTFHQFMQMSQNHPSLTKN